MSSKTLALTAHAGRTSGAVIESSIGSLRVTQVFDADAAAARLTSGGPYDRVVATLEPSAAAFRILDLPFRDRRRISQSAGPALEEHVPFSLDDGVLAWDFASPVSADAGAKVLAAIVDGSRLDAAKARIAALGPGAEPKRLVWEPSAILTAYRRALGDDASFIVLDAGDGGAVLARIEAGRLGALRIVAPCADDLLLRNIAWSLSTVAGGESRIVLGGRHAERLRDALEARLPAFRIERLPVASPVEGFSGHDWRELTSLVGLVLASGGDALPPLLDFEQGADSILGLGALREVQSEAAPLVRWGAAALLLGIVAVGIDYVQLYAERSSLAERAEQIYTSAMPSGSGGAGRKLKMEMKLRELTGKAESQAGGAGSPLALLAALSRDVPKQLDVVVDQVEHSPPSAKVAGHAGSFEIVTKMQEELQKGGSFSSVEVKDVHASVAGGGVEFLLELKTADTGGGA
jgi:hypothetical protein